MYRPPNCDSNAFLGSYNLDFLKLTRHQTTNDFIQNNLNFGLILTIIRPTRITQTTATLIDRSNIIAKTSVDPT